MSAEKIQRDFQVVVWHFDYLVVLRSLLSVDNRTGKFSFDCTSATPQIYNDQKFSGNFCRHSLYGQSLYGRICSINSETSSRNNFCRQNFRPTPHRAPTKIQWKLDENSFWREKGVYVQEVEWVGGPCGEHWRCRSATWQGCPCQSKTVIARRENFPF